MGKHVLEAVIFALKRAGDWQPGLATRGRRYEGVVRSRPIMHASDNDIKRPRSNLQDRSQFNRDRNHQNARIDVTLLIFSREWLEYHHPASS